MGNFDKRADGLTLAILSQMCEQGDLLHENLEAGGYLYIQAPLEQLKDCAKGGDGMRMGFTCREEYPGWSNEHFAYFLRWWMVLRFGHGNRTPYKVSFNWDNYEIFPPIGATREDVLGER